MTIHWCGTGLSAIPGLRRLIEGGHKVTVWNRTIEKAKAEVGDLTDDIRAFDIDALGAVLENGKLTFYDTIEEAIEAHEANMEAETLED